MALLVVACGGGSSPAGAGTEESAAAAAATSPGTPAPETPAAAVAETSPAGAPAVEEESPGEALEGNSTAEAGDVADQMGLATQGFPAQCPATNASFDAQNAATYQVFGELPIEFSHGTTGFNYFFIGTAWAVRERLLVTNAHVVAAFDDTAAQGVQLSRVLAVQSGTGIVVRLLRSFTHPDYTGSPLTSPDVGLFSAQEVLPAPLPLAPPDSVLGLGDDIQIVGFPGDVDDFITTQPGTTIPQATSLLGTISSRRSHDDREAVVGSTLDVYQHQAPTTPGTSGSSMVHCGLVAGANNAGTVKLVVSPSATTEGEFDIVRQAAASNNFGVHVKYIHNLIDLFDANALEGQALPVAASAAPAPPPPPAGGGGGGGGGGGAPPAEQSLMLFGAVTDPAAEHEFLITIDAQGVITGQSLWPATGLLTLAGRVAADGSVQFTDNAPEQLGFRRGIYQGQLGADGTISGIYFEQSQEGQVWPFVTIRQ